MTNYEKPRSSAALQAALPSPLIRPRFITVSQLPFHQSAKTAAEQSITLIIMIT
jgi:hypothetical protein